MRVIDSSIEIAAAPEEVWAVLTDFSRYEEWNPFVIRAEGEATVGTTLTLDIRPPGGTASTHHPTVRIAEPGRHLRWLGTAGKPWLLSARHDFVLEPAGTGTRLRHSETFTGLLVLPLKRTLDQSEKGFAQLNQALKERAEGHRPAS
ncbi:SRPBCC domain-containing protein [Sphaerisporangium sp. B11E5]|uniref:SRPBCC domain-containing protein n=1 Tax=Sphaerisporangium sp. B11E5 TaxID=3153563 RepID=UPI00325F1F33